MLDILEDNPAWAKVAPSPECPGSPVPYSPIIMPGFDEEEYVNRLEENEDAADAIVVSSNEAANLVEEVGITVVEASVEKTAKEPGEDTREDVNQDPPPEL